MKCKQWIKLALNQNKIKVANNLQEVLDNLDKYDKDWYTNQRLTRDADNV